MFRVVTNIARIYTRRAHTSTIYYCRSTKESNTDLDLIQPTPGRCVAAALNDQINKEYTAGYTYQSIAYHYADSKSGLLGLSKLYQRFSKEEFEHAQQLANYLLLRNGTVKFTDIRIAAPSLNYDQITETLQHAITIETHVSQSLSRLYRMAEAEHDVALMDFLVQRFFTEQIESLRQLNLLLCRWKLLSNDANGLYFFDRELLKRP